MYIGRRRRGDDQGGRGRPTSLGPGRPVRRRPFEGRMPTGRPLRTTSRRMKTAPSTV